ncbi:MAG: hypothetical protein ABL936_18955 [Aestuariivirga sp.]
MRFILVLTLIGPFLSLPFAEKAQAMSCQEVVSARETLFQISDELGKEIGQTEPCSAAQLDQVRRRHIALDAMIKAGDLLVEKCGYEITPEGRKKNVVLLAKLADFKKTCAVTDAIEEMIAE